MQCFVMDFGWSISAKCLFAASDIAILIGVNLELERIDIILCDEAWIQCVSFLPYPSEW